MSKKLAPVISLLLSGKNAIKAKSGAQETGEELAARNAASAERDWDGQHNFL